MCIRCDIKAKLREYGQPVTTEAVDEILAELMVRAQERGDVDVPADRPFHIISGTPDEVKSALEAIRDAANQSDSEGEFMSKVGDILAEVNGIGVNPHSERQKEGFGAILRGMADGLGFEKWVASMVNEAQNDNPLAAIIPGGREKIFEAVREAAMTPFLDAGYTSEMIRPLIARQQWHALAEIIRADYPETDLSNTIAKEFEIIEAYRQELYEDPTLSDHEKRAKFSVAKDEMSSRVGLLVHQQVQGALT